MSRWKTTQEEAKPRVEHGRVRRNVEYAWPVTLYRERPSTKLIYLDLNHWIHLAKAYGDHRDGRRHRKALAACIQAVASERAIFPLSAISYLEIANIRNHRQRRDLRNVIELLSRYYVVTGRPIISAHEVEAALDKIGLRSPTPIVRKSYLDWGVLRALGMKGDIRIRTREGADVTDRVRASYPDGPDPFDGYMWTQHVNLNRAIIDGPTPEEEEDFRQAGWRPQATLAACKGAAEHEAGLNRSLDEMPRWRRGRLRDVVAARELAYELNEVLYAACNDRKVDLGDLAENQEKMRETFDAMPGFDVAVTLKTAYHRNSTHRWKYNDIYDIHALASTLPYCDVVVTDRAMETQIRQTGLARRLGAVVLAEVSDVVEHL